VLPQAVTLPVDVAAELAHPVLVRAGVVLSWSRFDETVSDVIYGRVNL
jgi:hypothetical protein